MKHGFFPPHFVVKNGIHGVGVFTTSPVKKGEMLFKMKGPILETPTRTSVQIGANKHIEDKLAGYMNHNCTPSAKVDRDSQSFISLKDMKAGEEITFNYNQNEDLMASPFMCGCCNKMIEGRKNGMQKKVEISGMDHVSSAYLGNKE